MSKPYNDKDLINERLNAVGILMKPANRPFVIEVEKYLRHIQNIPKVLLRIKKVESTFNDWAKVLVSLENGTQILQLIVQFINDEDNDFSDKLYLQNLIADINILEIQEFSHNLGLMFDFKQPQANLADNNRFIIKEGFDSQYDKLRFTFDSLDQYLVTAAHKVLDVTPLLNTIRVEYIQQLGYLVLVRKEDMNFVQHDESFRFVFSEDNAGYYKHPIVEDLDNTVGDIKSILSDYQKMLILQVEERLLDLETQMHKFSEMLATLDAHISMAVISTEMKFTRPEIVEDNLIIIKNGRHPLQELTVETFVPNDTYINGEKSIALITGPNSSGKSVYLKQVGIIIYLAHIGCYVPSEKAIVGLTDRIMTRISSVETAASPQSSFSLDLCQVNLTAIHIITYRRIYNTGFVFNNNRSAKY